MDNDKARDISIGITEALQSKQLIPALDPITSANNNNPETYNFAVQDVIHNEICKRLRVKEWLLAKTREYCINELREEQAIELRFGRYWAERGSIFWSEGADSWAYVKPTKNIKTKWGTPEDLMWSVPDKDLWFYYKCNQKEIDEWESDTDN